MTIAIINFDTDDHRVEVDDRYGGRNPLGGGIEPPGGDQHGHAKYSNLEKECVQNYI